MTSRPTWARALRAIGVTLALALGLTAAAAPAQPDAEDAPPTPATSAVVAGEKPRLFATIGWGGRIQAETWTPVTITIQGGIEPFSGVVTIDYAQDAMQGASITVPVSATPGKMSTVVAAVCLPAVCDHITMRLVGPRGRAVQTLAFDRTPSNVELLLPMIGGLSETIVGAIGRRGGPAASVALIEQGLSATPTRRSTAFQPRLIPPDELPLAWGPYESLAVLAVDAESATTADPRSIAAVREWVSGGGRLVIIAPDPGSGWRAWLPPSWVGSYVSLDEPRRAPIPADLAGVVRSAEHQAAAEETDAELILTDAPRPMLAPPGVYGPFRPFTPHPRPSAPAAETDPDAPNADEDADTEPEHPDSPPILPAEVASQRMIRLTPHGSESGWRVRWRPDAAPPNEAWVEPPQAWAMEGSSGLLAEGPVGLGWVTIIGIDPRRAASVSQDAATRVVWDAVLETSLAERMRLADAAASSQWGAWYMTSEAELARVAVLNELADAPGASSRTFLVIVVAMVALALLMGPFDALVLRRLRARHRSWLTALTWIALATAAAYTAPMMSRTAGTSVARFSVADVLVPAAGEEGEANALAWQTSVTGVFAAQTLRGALVPSPVLDAPTPASWWRGFSAIAMHNPERALAASVQSVQTLPDLGSVDARRDPWGGWGNGSPRAAAPPPSPDDGPALAPAAATPIAGGNTMLPSVLRTWTFRSLADQARVAPPCLARARVSPDGEGTIDIIGLPPGARVVSAACRIGSWWQDLTPVPAGGGEAGTLRATLKPEARRADPPAAWAPRDLQQNAPWGYNNQAYGAVRSFPVLSLSLAGADRRAMAVDALAGSGRWAAVYLMVENMPADVALTGHPAGTRTLVCRLLTPIEPPADDPAGDTDDDNDSDRDDPGAPR